MSESRIFEGRTTNEAIEKGLKELKVSKSDVEIKVIENEEKRSFFDILAPRVVKVEMKIKEDATRERPQKPKIEVEVDIEKLKKAQELIKEFLDKFFEKTIGEKIDINFKLEKNVISVIIDDKKADFLIGYRGETLNAVQTILTAIAIKECDEKVRVELDILNYREKRKKALEELAEKIAKSVIRTKKSITLEPMTPYERKIIHEKLQDNTKVKTISIGEGTHRKVVVSLK